MFKHTHLYLCVRLARGETLDFYTPFLQIDTFLSKIDTRPFIPSPQKKQKNHNSFIVDFSSPVKGGDNLVIPIRIL